MYAVPDKSAACPPSKVKITICEGFVKPFIIDGEAEPRLVKTKVDVLNSPPSNVPVYSPTASLVQMTPVFRVFSNMVATGSSVPVCVRIAF